MDLDQFFKNLSQNDVPFEYKKNVYVWRNRWRDGKMKLEKAQEILHIAGFSRTQREVWTKSPEKEVTL